MISAIAASDATTVNRQLLRGARQIIGRHANDEQ
jgi:hypothetical protein